MSGRHGDGSAGDADYGAIGARYAAYRRPDPRIAALIHDCLGDAESVLNVGAGTGSYEPADRAVTAVEPSATMRAQRPAGLPPAVDAVAERLPFADASFDAAMAIFTIHQWRDLAAGLAEMRRVTRGPVVILSCRPEKVHDFWLSDFAPGVLDAEMRRYPFGGDISAGLGRMLDILPVPIPLDCSDGFNEAYYGRPEMLLDPGARQACSAWSVVSPETAERSVDALRAALDSGRWDDAYGALRRQPTYRGSLSLFVSES